MLTMLAKSTKTKCNLDLCSPTPIPTFSIIISEGFPVAYQFDSVIGEWLDKYRLKVDVYDIKMVLFIERDWLWD